MQITRDQKRNRLSPFLLYPAIAISFLSIVTLIYTVPPNTVVELTNLPLIATKQIWFLLIGVIVFLVTSRFDYTYLKFKPLLLLIYLSTIILLILTLIFGEEVKGAQRWLSFAGIQLQPSELAKITVIVVTAYIMTFQNRFNEYLTALISFLFTLPLLILIYLQPHGSMSILLMAIWFVTVFFSLHDQLRNLVMILIFILVVVGIWGTWILGNAIFLSLCGFGLILYIYTVFSKNSWQYLSTIIFVLAIVSGLIFSYSWNSILLPYQKDRIVAFINPESADPSSTFNVEQSKIAIGSGKIFGKGFGNGTQASRDFLPEHQTDFIFASYAEQVGLVGSIALITLYAVILLTIFRFPIITSSNLFATTIIVALGMKILIELFINLGTNLGITPATGIPLPLLSAGGTITLVTFFTLGLIQSIMNSREFVDN